MSFLQGRRLLTSLVRRSGYRSPPQPTILRRPRYDPRMEWPPMPRPLVMDMIKTMKRLSAAEKLKFGYIFAELLGLPEPPEVKSKDTEEKFVVKLVSFDPDKMYDVETAVAKVMFTKKVIKSLYELTLSPAIKARKNLPSVVIENVSKEKATGFIAKIEAAGGVAVMEPMG